MTWFHLQNDDDFLYKVAIGLIPGIGHALTRQLIGYCGSASAVFRMPGGKLRRIPQIGEALATQIVSQNVLHLADKEINLAVKYGVSLHFFTDEHYPVRLRNIEDAPALLYSKGKAPLSPARTVAIVGTRSATEYGKEVTRRMVEGFKPFDAQIISGLAYGIDAEAHKASIQYGVSTIAVMGTGMDIIYPYAHKKLSEEMLANNGMLLTENPFGTKPDIHRFPARNRIVAGLSEAVIVVEAAVKGGALITANLAGDYYKEVFAVPGNLGQKYSEGCLNLIRENKAAIYTSAEQVAEALGWNNKKARETEPGDKFIRLNGEEEKKIYTLLDVTGLMHLDDLSWKSGIPINRLASVLLEMEFAGFVKTMPGKMFKLNRV